MDHESNLVRMAAILLFASMWQGLALAACTEVFLRFAPSVSAKIRFRLWSATFYVCCLLPLIELGHKVLIPLSPSPLVATNVTGSIPISMSFARGSLIIWSIASAASLVRLISGLWAVNDLIATSMPAPANLLSLKNRAIDSNVTSARLLISKRVSAPIVAGITNPAIIMPVRLLESLSEEHLIALLQHESQHLVRRDPWTTLTFRFLRGLFPLNPSLWYIEHRLSLAREMACDDGVLSTGISPENYANCLVQISELAFQSRSNPFVSGLLGSPSQIFIRVDRVLSLREPNTSAVAFSTIATTALIVLAGLLVTVPDVVSIHLSIALQSSGSESVSPEPPDEWLDYLSSPAGYPPPPSVRPPSMPTLKFPSRVQHAATSDMRKAVEG